MRHPWIAAFSFAAAATFAAAGCDRDQPASPVTEAKAGPPPPADKPAPTRPRPAAEPPAAAPSPGGDPHGGRFTLAEALAGLPDQGTLTATIATSLGTFTCELYEKEAPITVANFVGLARGLRAWQGPGSGEWVKRPLYDGLTFHRVIPGFMIQGGDPEGTGRGGPGYAIEEEFHRSRRHDRAGILSMAKKPMPRTTGSQFFVTDGPTPHLDDRHSVFGHCQPASLVSRIAGVPKADGPGGSRPAEAVTIEKVTIARK